MAWKWFEIKSYKASVGGDRYYGGLQLMGADNFYANLRFHKSGPLPASSTPAHHGNRFFGHLDWQQMAAMVDLLRNEEPLRFGFDERRPDHFHLMTGTEAVGEGDGVLAVE